MNAEQTREELQQISPVVNILRVFGILTCALGAAEVGLGVTIFMFLDSMHPGAWYVGAAIILVCILAFLLEKSFSLVIVGVLSGLVTVVAIVGALVDGITWNVLDHTRGCYNPYLNEYYGQSGYEVQATECSSAPIGDAAYKGHCYCVQAGNDFCFHYNIADSDKYDCNDVLHEYTHWLHDSTIICSVIAIGSVAYCIFLCTGGCYNCWRPKPYPVESNPDPYNNATTPLIDDIQTVYVGFDQPQQGKLNPVAGSQYHGNSPVNPSYVP